METQSSMQNMQQNMPNYMAMKEPMNAMMTHMQKHHNVIYAFDLLVLIGFATIIIFLSKILKELRKK